MATKSALVSVCLLAAAAVVACGDDNNNNNNQPQPKVFNVPLLVSGETPPCAAAGASATGNATVTIPNDNSSVMVSATYSGLSGPVTAGHIHFGGTSAAGPVVLPFGPPLDSGFTKTLTAADYVPGTGVPPDFATFVTALKAGGAGYVNLHTDACKPGEIRGEVQ